MIGQPYEDRGFWETVLDSRAAVEPNQPVQAWPLAEEIKQLLGADAQPDPLFFEESWAYGAAAAAENLRRRHRQQTEGVVFAEFDNLGAQAYVQQRASWADDFPAPIFNTVAGDANAQWPQGRGDWQAARRLHDSRQWQSVHAEHVSQPATSDEMTLPLACRLLGVTATSSHQQIKTAYRRMVGQWHPDRMQHRSEEMRHFANDQMSAINQAYSLLREHTMQQAA